MPAGPRTPRSDDDVLSVAFRSLSSLLSQFHTFTGSPAEVGGVLMSGPFSKYLETVEKSLRSEHRKLLRGSLYLTIQDWYMDGIEPQEAAVRIRNAVDGYSPTTAITSDLIRRLGSQQRPNWPSLD